MNLLAPSTPTSSLPFLHPPKSLLSLPTPPLRNPLFSLAIPLPRLSSLLSLSRASPHSAPAAPLSSPHTRWLVLVERPPGAPSSKAEVIDYFVSTLAKVVGSEKDAQACIYDVSWRTHYGFCCDVDEETSRQLAGLPGVLSVRQDTSSESCKDYSFSSSDGISRSDKKNTKFSDGNGKYWLVRVEKPGVEVVTKAQMVDYYSRLLTKVMGNEKDAQVSIYNISWEKDLGFCCHIDEDCAEELADVPGVMSVHPDPYPDSQNKNYGVKEDDSLSSQQNQIENIKTKRLFVTGLSFYTSEKTLRAAFEVFGELVEVKVIMDKISKRSKGYAFIEYTTEEAAGAALREMNGKIINGWMIVVDVAKINPQRSNRVQSSAPSF